MRITRDQLRRIVLQEKRRLIRETNDSSAPSREAFWLAQRILRSAVKEMNDILGKEYATELEDEVDKLLNSWSSANGFEL